MTHGPSLSLVALERYIQQDAMPSVYHRFMTVTCLVFLGVLEIRIKLLLDNFKVRDHLDNIYLYFSMTIIQA
jgi:hypothetical protein